MNFLTNIPLKTQRYNQINYDSKLLLLGSCFVENISKKLDYFKFKNATNPFGILFHPKAIENLVTNAVNEKTFDSSDLFFLNEQWHCFDAHSNFSDSNKEQLLSNLNNSIKVTYQQLKKSTHIIITLGTSWIYRFIETDQIVANCHKVPQKKFLKELLSIQEIIESLESIITLVKMNNPEVNFILTTSPIRHLKNGFIENSQSKSHLIAAIHQIVEPRKKIYYFPSYEIMMDELRDYRFYSSNMIHPNETAIDYIWEKFKYVWIDKQTQLTMKEVDNIQKGLNHKPFNPSSNQYQQFISSLKQKMETLQKAFPSIKF